MKKYLITSAFALLALGSSAIVAEPAGDWVSLFDGKTLTGWKPSTVGTATYAVVDGAIRGETVEGSPHTFLVSEAQYGDFELEFEVKVHDSLNSGVQIR